MTAFWQDLRYAVRMLLKSPGFAAVAILTLGLGIGANTAIFTVANALLLRPLPYANPQRLALVYATSTADRSAVGPFSYPRFAFLRQQQRSFSGISAFTNDSFDLTGRGEPRQISAARVSWNFFDVLGVKPIAGRTFFAGEGQPAGNRVVMISHDFWMREFGGSPAAIGQSLALDSQSYTIVGVLPPVFSFQPLGNDIPLWIPREFELNIATPAHIQRGMGYLDGVARLAPGVTFEQARAEMDALDREYRHDNPEKPDADQKRPVTIDSLQSQVVANIRPAILILMGAVGVVLLIACANVASLLLARGLKRKKEIAVRTALGAARRVIIRQLLVESLLLAAAGGVAGVLLGYAGTRALVALNPNGAAQLTNIHMDWRVLCFTMAISVLGGIFFGLVPAMQLSKTDLTSVLREEGRSSTVGRRGAMSQNALVVAQIALSMILLIGSGLLIRSFIRMVTLNPGFDANHVVTMQIVLPPSRYSTSAQMISFYNQILRQTENLPGVEAAAISSALPINPSRLTPMLAEGQPVVPFPQRPVVNIETISPAYAKVMRVPLIRGREFTAEDNESRPAVAIVNQAYVRRFWPSTNPIGKHLWIGLITTPIQVVGVFGDVKNMGLTAATNPEIFLPFPNLPWANLRLLLRASGGDAQSLVPAVRQRLESMDSNQAITHVQTLEQLIESARAQSRFTVALFGIFSGVALVLAIVGIYGVISYAVAQRTHEIGVRIALGASRENILRLVIGRGLRLAVLGIAIGLVASFTLTPLMASLLYKISPADPLTIIGSAILFLAAALLASYIPARRAMRTDPMVALRYE